MAAHIWNLGSQSVPIGLFVKQVHQGVNDSDVLRNAQRGHSFGKIELLRIAAAEALEVVPHRHGACFAEFKQQVDKDVGLQTGRKDQKRNI